MSNKVDPELFMEKMDEIIFWLRLISLPVLKNTMSQLLDTKEKEEVYSQTDGQKSVREISKGTDVPVATVQRWWTEWSEKGILRDSTKYKGRKQKVL